MISLHRCRIVVSRVVLCLSCCLVGPAAAVENQDDRFFENEIRPILIEQCYDCHGTKKQESGLRVDSRVAIVKGGDQGAAIVPGNAADSLLIQAVRHEGDLQMPPNRKLKDRQIRALERWVRQGAAWPAGDAVKTKSTAENAKQHWAFQPVGSPQVPSVANHDWVRTPIDAFVMARLEAGGLAPSPRADRRDLIRRATYSLTGLPPAPEDVACFVKNEDPKAFERLIDRLIDSPAYGEQWARHWLDVARYSDTKGYVYAREERFWVHAWTYRDWVVKALNDDMPYNRFLLLQMAADQVPGRSQADLAAMGFLTLGRRFLGVQRDIIDDRIDVVCRGTMGLTVGCARCHDHKYDDIPTADYYSLYGVFANCAERLVPLADLPVDEAYRNELRARQEKLQTKLAASRAESSNRVRERIGDYLRAQTELHKYPANGFDQIFQKTDLLPAFVRRWEDYLYAAKRRDDPIFVPWHAYAELPVESFADRAIEVTQRIHNQFRVHPIVADAFIDPPKSFDDVIDRYTAIFTAIHDKWQSKVADAATQKAASPTEMADASEEDLRRVLYGPAAPCQVPDQGIVHTETFFDSGTCTQLWKLQGSVDRWIIDGKTVAPFALTLVDRPVVTEPRIFRRGDPLKKGAAVPRQFLRLLRGDKNKPFRHGSGRLELAHAIVDPSNPLTARVIVNRVWTHHFGQGLVTTPSDFGVRADPPSHPDLLDWLASRFVDEGWSLKKLHRWIMTSAAYQQSSRGPATSDDVAKTQQLDPANRLLWRMNPRRLAFEEFRDSLLAAGNQLDLRVGGRPSDLFKQPYPKRRTLYGLVDRQFLPSTLRMFDFANPDLHIPRRNETTVPQQALFFLNHPLVLDRARALAKVGMSLPLEQRVGAMFQQTFQRPPDAAELAEAMELVHRTTAAETRMPSATVADWQYGFGEVDESNDRVKGFTRLPHFTGTAWQGGPNWPDAELGWVQLTATGGHPGNDRRRASIRRWIAPRPITIEIESRLVHEPAAGDGIRAFIVSSRGGLLRSATAHQENAELNVESLEVDAGETIDFVVDIDKVLNSDQYLWEATIRERAENGQAIAWNSKADFPDNSAERLTAWQQLAQVLLCSNEFLFVD